MRLVRVHGLHAAECRRSRATAALWRWCSRAGVAVAWASWAWAS